MAMVDRMINRRGRLGSCVRIPALLALGATLLVACAGCQPTTGTVSGTVTVDGKAVALSNDARGSIAFHPSSGQGAMATGVLDSKGRYQLSTGAVPQVQPGKYQVTVSIVELMPRVEDTEQSGRLVTQAKYGSAIDSGLQANVVPGLNEIKFDLESEAEADGAPAAAEADESTLEVPIAAENSTSE
jgi:hypothetical protein